MAWANGITEWPCSGRAGGNRGAAPLLKQQRPRSRSVPANPRSNCIEYMRRTAEACRAHARRPVLHSRSARVNSGAYQPRAPPPKVCQQRHRRAMTRRQSDSQRAWPVLHSLARRESRPSLQVPTPVPMLFNLAQQQHPRQHRRQRQEKWSTPLPRALVLHYLDQAERCSTCARSTRSPRSNDPSTCS